MYKFVDTTEAPGGIILPSEALSINGEYIENLIPGYRTLNVTGREALSPDVTTYETGLRDGATLQGKKYPARILAVTYQLNAQDDKAFRDAYNQLGKILDVTDAILIFNDEQDKYYTGTPCIIGEVTPGTNAVVGKFEIICTDPFKYSVTEYEVYPDMDAKSFLFDYGGTYKAYPILEADFYQEQEVAEDGETATALTGAGDCGYVAFYNEKEKIIQLGDPEEGDIEDGYAKSQTMINQTFMGNTAWGATAKGLWSLNNGSVLPAKVQQMGNVAMAPADQYTTTWTEAQSKGLLDTAKTVGCFYYWVTATTSNRTGSSVDIRVNITVKNQSCRNKTGKLTISMCIGGVWKNVTQTVTKTGWAINAAKTYYINFTVTGLTTQATTLNGILFKVVDTASHNGATDQTHGETITQQYNCVGMPVAALNSNTVILGYFLAPSDYGTKVGAWHGPSITRQIPADLSGEVGAANFALTYKQKMCIGTGTGATDQKGSFQMMLTAANGTVIAGIRIIKSASGKSGNLVFYVNGQEVNSTPIDLHHNNYYFGSSESAVQTTQVLKEGATISFVLGSYKRQFYVKELEDVKATRVTFTFEKYSELTPLAYNGLYWAKFVKHNCATYKQVPNKFSAHDVLEADCKTGEIYLNGLASPNLGALGNDWESFYLAPGINQIGVAYSEWVPVKYRPTFKVRYREVFL